MTNDLFILLAIVGTVFFLFWHFSGEIRRLNNLLWEHRVRIQDLEDDLNRLTGEERLEYRFEHRRDGHTAYRERASTTTRTAVMVKDFSGVDKSMMDTIAQQLKDGGSE